MYLQRIYELVPIPVHVGRMKTRVVVVMIWILLHSLACLFTLACWIADRLTKLSATLEMVGNKIWMLVYNSWRAKLTPRFIITVSQLSSS